MDLDLDLDLARTIAAFGGLGLGLLNFGILLHKEYIRKPLPCVTLKRADIRAVLDGTFDLQIDLDMNVSGGDLYLKEIFFEHRTPVFDPVRGVTKRTVYKIVDYPGYCTLNAGVDEFRSKYEELFGSAYNVANTKLTDKEHKIISIIDRICTVRFTDGYWEWPRNGWSLIVVTSAGEETVPFQFSIHETNKVNAFC